MLVIRDPPTPIVVAICSDDGAKTKAQCLRFSHKGKLGQRLAGMTPEEMTSIAVALLAGSELLSYVPGIKANGWVQLVVAALQGIAAAAQEGKSKKRRR